MILNLIVNAVIFSIFFTLIFLLIYKMKMLKIKFIPIFFFSAIMYFLVAFLLKKYINL
jgi:hypothetical protein